MPRVVRHPPIPQRADAGDDRLDVVQAGGCEGLTVERSGGASAAATGEEIQDAGRAELGTRALRGRLGLRSSGFCFIRSSSICLNMTFS